MAKTLTSYADESMANQSEADEPSPIPKPRRWSSSGGDHPSLARSRERFRGVVPLLSNQIEGGRTPMPGVGKLEEMGYAMAIFSLGVGFAAAKGMKNYLETLAAKGDTSAMAEDMVAFEDFNRLVGLDEHAELDRRYKQSG